MKTPDNILQFNRDTWNRLSRNGNRWTVPASAEEMEAAYKGSLHLVLTPVKEVPAEWYPVKGAEVLCLASGGGQQVPLLAAAGYRVTSFDLSEMQLQTDQRVCESYGLSVTTIQGDMQDLHALSDELFDCVFNPCSTSFIPDVRSMYREAARVLKPGGIFMTGFVKPVNNLFDLLKAEEGIFQLKYSSPYSDLEGLNDEEKEFLKNQDSPLVFGHSLEALIHGQLEAGLTLTHLFEDNWGGNNPVDKYFPAFVATRAVKQSYNV